MECFCYFYPCRPEKNIKKYVCNKQIQFKLFSYGSALFLGGITLYGLVQQAITTYQIHTCSPGETSLNNLVSAARWLKENVPDNSIIAATQIAIPHRISGLN